MHFLEESRPYRSLQHPALVQCLAQCTEVTPYLLIMEFCPLGDVKGYLRSYRAADTGTPDPLLLQRMACQIASGLLHLHKHDFIHSDLALRNCFLTSDVTVKIGDYGLAQSKYKDDYFVTADQSCVPLRWMAPELVDDVHGNLLVADQTKQSNIWSLGVTIWELFELGNQPYGHYSDRQVLSYAVKEQQLKLPKPLLDFPLSERWYEVMQFCWLQSDQRPNGEEVQLLLSYLCAKGSNEAEDDFERRWNSMRPNSNDGIWQGAGSLSLEMPQSCNTSSSFPLLEQFSGDGYQSESGDDILTVTETSHGLNFEYKWEQARAKQPHHSSSTTGTLGKGNPLCHEVYYPPGGMVGGCGFDGHNLGVSSQYYEPKPMSTPGVVPVLSAYSPSLNSEYYIRIEEPVECSIDLDYTMCTYSPEFRGSTGSFLTGSGDSGDCMICPSRGKTVESYWSADIHKGNAYDSDSSPALSLSMEPLLGQESDSSPLRPWESGHYVSYKDRDGGVYYEHSPPLGGEHFLIGDSSEPLMESWGSRSLRQALGELEDPLGISSSVGTPPQSYSHPYLESTQSPEIGKNIPGGYYDMMGSLRKIMPGSHSVCIDVETTEAVFLGPDDSDSEEEEDLFVERQTVGWTSNHSVQNTMSWSQSQCSSRQDVYADFHYTMPMTDVEDAWPKQPSLPYHSAKMHSYPEARAKSNTCPVHGRQASVSSADCNPYIHLCHEPREVEVYPVPCCQALSNSHFVDPLTGSLVRNCFMNDNISDKNISLSNQNQQQNQVTLPIGTEATKSEPESDHLEYVDISPGEVTHKVDIVQNNLCQIADSLEVTPKVEESLPVKTSTDPKSDRTGTMDSGVDNGHSSLMENDNATDDDITDITSGIFGDFQIDAAEVTDCASSSVKSLQTPDSMDSIDLPSTMGSSETFSPTSLHPSSSSPRAMDSGYDTENNESPEFVIREPHDSQDSISFIQQPGMSAVNTHLNVKKQEELIKDEERASAATTSPSTEDKLCAISEETPNRDSAYFSDNDTGKEKEMEEEIEKDTDGSASNEEDNTKMVSKEIPTLLMEHEDGLPIVSEPEPMGDELHSCTGLILKADEMVSYSSSKAWVPSPGETSAESTATDTVQSKDFDCLQNELPLETQPLDLVTSTFFDKPETEETKESDRTQPSETEEDTEDYFYKEKEVMETTCLEEPIPQDMPSVELCESDVTERVSTEKTEILSSTLKDGVQRLKNSTRPSSPPPPPPQLDGRTSPVDGADADDEDKDSDDSDESDEELRSYCIQDQSEESEDEVLTVPIIVSDCSDAHKLRSLLKTPSSLPDEMESKKKVVSFFNDVTVFLFNQESPTSELTECASSLGGNLRSSAESTADPNQQEKAFVSDDFSDANVSEETAALEWEDDFSLPPLETSLKESPPDRKSNPSNVTNSKPVVQFSRFTVSPSSISRFSITHVSDSDLDSAGGSSEDGERE